MKLTPFLLLLGLLSACAPSANPVVTLKVGSQEFRTEIVNSPEGREKGYMERRGLTDDVAMVFVFPDEDVRNFWMKNTPNPLSIAYISKQGVIKEIYDMAAESEATVPSYHAVQYALEVNQGAFLRRGVQVGDSIDLSVLKEFAASR